MMARHHPELHLAHLEARMVQSGHWPSDRTLTAVEWRTVLDRAINTLNIDQARADVQPFVPDPDRTRLWSHEFFRDVARRIVPV